jgi:hypothetical protein
MADVSLQTTTTSSPSAPPPPSIVIPRRPTHQLSALQSWSLHRFSEFGHEQSGPLALLTSRSQATTTSQPSPSPRTPPPPPPPRFSFRPIVPSNPSSSVMMSAAGGGGPCHICAATVTTRIFDCCGKVFLCELCYSQKKHYRHGIRRRGETIPAGALCPMCQLVVPLHRVKRTGATWSSSSLLKGKQVVVSE